MNKSSLYRKELELLEIIKIHLDNFDVQNYINEARDAILDLFYEGLYSLKNEFLELIPVSKLSKTRHLLDTLKIISGQCGEDITFANSSQKRTQLINDVEELITLMKEQIKIKSNMTVFYSWQSDCNPKENRNFIKDCIEDAIKQYNKENNMDILKFDSDTRGVCGSPEIINAILNKIDNSLIFIADITPIIRKENDLIPNPNVMFELGYAISSLWQSRVILLLNKKYGECENLPFDIQHKRITIYNYSEGEDKKNKQNELVSTIKNAISMIANN